VGLLEDWEKSATIGFNADDRLLVIGGPDVEGGNNLGRSLWLQEVCGRANGAPPLVDLQHERSVGEFVRQLVSLKLASAVHDVSDGGIMVAIAEMCLARNIGAIVDDDYGCNTDFLFGESQGTYIVASSDDNFLAIVELAESKGIDVFSFAYAGGLSLAFNNSSQRGFEIPLADLRAAHEGFFPKLMGSELTPEF
jgi:phosphoribosylformylglycinamidine synthase